MFLIFVQQVAVIGGLGPVDLFRRQVIKDRCLFKRNLPVMFINIDSRLPRLQASPL